MPDVYSSTVVLSTGRAVSIDRCASTILAPVMIFLTGHRQIRRSIDSVKIYCPKQTTKQYNEGICNYIQESLAPGAQPNEGVIGVFKV